MDIMAHVGKISEFVEGKEDFQCYIERVEQYFVANGVKDEKQVAVFLSLIGPQAYALLRNLLTPDLPSSKTFDVLKTTLKEHYMPKPSVIGERFKFHNRHQREGESVSDYLVSLKQLATDCEFKDFLNEAIRDRFVCGLRSDLIQKKLLAEKDLTLKMATETALAMEMAAKSTNEMHSSAVDCNKLQFRPRKQKPADSGKKPTNYYKKNKSYTGENCYRCGGKHPEHECKFKTSKCFGCSQIGHIAKKCPNKQKGLLRNQYVGAGEERQDSSDEFSMYGIYQTTSRVSQGYKVPISLDGNGVSMELDTGAAVSVISETLYQKHLSHLKLQPSSLNLRTYSGEKVSLLGEIRVPVKYGSQEETLPLQIAKGDKPSLFGRNWLEKIRLDWQSIFSVTQKRETDNLEDLLSKHARLFDKSIGTIQDFTAQIRVKPEAQPIFCKARPVPFALREALEKEIERLEGTGVISKVDRSDWAAPVVVVPKTDNSIRLCGDFKVTVNQCLDEQQYPLPNVEDMFAKLAGGQKFTKLDLSQAYQQLILDDASKPLLTINTHMGLYRYHRLPYGVSAAPAIFQSVMDQILQGLDYVVCRIDDILITAPNDAKHLDTLGEVLRRLDKHNIRLRKDKCVFLQSKVGYMGHLVDETGIHPTEEKVEAIKDAPEPNNVTELKSFLGLVNYYGQYLPNLATTLQPLHELLRQDTEWKWTSQCEKAFQECKNKLTHDSVLVYYDVTKPVKLACDASAYGLGAVISHVMENGEERPIAYASRTLAPSERNYAQIEKEALALIFGVKKFHKYLYGRRFILVTDHKPLTRILGPKQGVPTLAAARMQRWALILAAYQYDIEYRKSAEHGNADGFSRLPLQKEVKTEEGDIFHFSHLDDLPVMAEDISRETKKDPVLVRVLDYTLNGWPNHVTEEGLKPYFQRREELSTDQGCLLWGLRVIIPPVFRQRLLEELHDQHTGMNRMKSLARSYLWWPGMDQAVEELVKACSVCQSARNMPGTAPLIPWNWPTRVWQRIHIDFAEKDKQYFLVVIDSHSKWLEVFHMSNITSSKTIEVLRSLFASYGMPEEVVSDNGPQFTSHEFEQFMSLNGIKHTLVPAYHPSSNGAAERSVQILKQALLKQVLDQEKGPCTVQHRLSNFLLKYRATPHSVTGVSPAELFLKRPVRTRLSLLKPNLNRKVSRQQERQKTYHDKGRTQTRSFERNQKVRVRNFRGGMEKWLIGQVVRQCGPLTYLVRVGPNIRYVHVDHLLSTGEKVESGLPSVRPVSVPIVREPVMPSLPVSSPKEIGSKPSDVLGPEHAPDPVPASDPLPEKPVEVTVRRNPPRSRRAPDRLDL